MIVKMFEYKVVGNFTLHKRFLYQNQNVTNGLNTRAQNIDQVVSTLEKNDHHFNSCNLENKWGSSINKYQNMYVSE